MINTFNFTINNLDQFQAPLLWQLSENYLNLGQKAYRVTKIENKILSLEEAVAKSSLFSTSVKILSYFTVFLPILALGIRTLYRKSYQFKMILKQVNSQIQILNNPSDILVNTNSMLTTASTLDSLVTKLRTAQAHGIKLGVFAGRSSDQSIPQESDWLWCSLDIAKATNTTNERIHLCMDLNDKATMDKIQGLFDKVVLDFCVIKFIDNPWNTLKDLLVCQPHAELITETWSGCRTITDTLKFDPKNATMSIPIVDLISNRGDERTQQLLEKIQIFLLDLFEEVEKKNGLYPYREGSEAISIDYWIARRPKIVK